MGGANPPSSSDSPIARIVIEPSVSTFRTPSGLQSGLITCPPFSSVLKRLPNLMVSSNRFYASSISPLLLGLVTLLRKITVNRSNMPFNGILSEHLIPVFHTEAHHFQ